MAGIECAGFTFYNDFDSANLARVQYVPPNESPIAVSVGSPGKVVPEIPDVEFNLWTKPDCFGTEFQNGNRTWFYFGMKAPSPGLLVRLNMVDLNRQGKMYSQGMAPVYRVIPGRAHWERIRDKPVHNTVDDIFTLSFKYRTPENENSVSYFAFTYPFSYADLQNLLENVHQRFDNFTPSCDDDIYYTNEIVCKSLGGRNVNLITISSYHGISTETEDRLKGLFPNTNAPRPHKFPMKKVVFVSSRVHPGETPSTFVFNGLLNLLLNREDPIAVTLRRLYVFKMIPFLNPDGVSQGHYRTDTRGVNLNRLYLNPSLTEHPSIYAARQLIRYHHFRCEKDDFVDKGVQASTQEEEDLEEGTQKNSQPDNVISMRVSNMSLEEKRKEYDPLWCIKCSVCRNCKDADCPQKLKSESSEKLSDENSNESGLFLYIDMHGHASKKGIFMYGNHFDEMDDTVECMLLPKILSINNHNFHFTACNFTERNMYLKDKRDGMSREGSGRVAVLKLTGLIKSYTLECNYNTGRLVNVLPPTVREPHGKVHTISVPPKYTPHVFEELGKSLGASILDLTGQNPCSRIPNSEFHNMTNLQEWIRINAIQGFGESRHIPTNFKFRHQSGLQNQGKTGRGLKIKTKTVIKRATSASVRPASTMGAPIDRKENIVRPHQQPGCSHSASECGAPKTTTRIKSLALKSKSKKELPYKFKSSTVIPDNNKTRNTRNNSRAIKSSISSATSKSTKKPGGVSSAAGNMRLDNKGAKKQDRFKLRDLCLMKENATKSLMGAKSKRSSETEDGSDIYLMWDGSGPSPKRTPRTPKSDNKRLSKSHSVPNFGSVEAVATTSASKSFRIHNFTKTANFAAKFKKHTLRRSTNTVDGGKVEKPKNRKKFKK